MSERHEGEWMIIKEKLFKTEVCSKQSWAAPTCMHVNVTRGKIWQSLKLTKKRAHGIWMEMSEAKNIHKI